VELEYKAKAGEPYFGPFVFRHGRGGAAIDQNVAAGRQVQQSQQIQQGGFSGAGRAGDGNELPRHDLEVDIPDQRHRHDAAEDLRHASRLDQRRAHVAPLMMSTGCRRAAARAGK
jgi:hypothetical protein